MILRPDLARELFEIGAVKFGAFKFKYHEARPELPLEPSYLNIRTPPDGPLTDELVRQLGGELLFALVGRDGIPYDGVVGIPRAGDPLATAFKIQARVPQIFLDKEEKEGIRRVVFRRQDAGGGPGIVIGECVLVIDDLITRAHSKLEAIEALKGMGLVVEHVLVLVDREQGGREELAERGVKLHAAWQFTELMAFYRDYGVITPEKHDEVIAFLRRQQAGEMA